MRLDIAKFHVTDVVFSDTTRLADGVLYVNKDELRGLVLQDDHFADVEIDLARPGDRTRIINILDVLEPRHKVSGPSTVFPGLLGPPVTVGEGKDHTLKGVNLVTTSEPAPGESLHWRDAIFDMWGPGARYTPFSESLNLVLQFQGRTEFSTSQMPDLELTDVIHGSKYSQEYNLAVRIAGFRVADYLASVTRDLEPDDVDTYELVPVNQSLPRVIYTLQQSEPILYGRSIGWQPTLLHPNEILDGAMTKNFVEVGSIRDPSHQYQNNPVIQELYRQHGEGLNFLGVLLYNYGGEQLPEKERITGYAAKLLKMMRVDGIVMTWNGGGHPGIDPMMLCQKCERLGIKTTLLNPEMAASQSEPGFVYFVPEADALVCTGNYERPITLSPAERVLGGTVLSSPEIDASGELSLTLRYLLGSTTPMGQSTLMGVQY